MKNGYLKKADGTVIEGIFPDEVEDDFFAYGSENPPDWVIDYQIENAPQVEPNWKAVRDRLLTDHAYTDWVVLSDDQLSLTRLEAAAIAASKDWPLLASLWNRVVNATNPDDLPDPETLLIWDNLLVENNLGVRLLPNGSMTPT